MAKKKRAFIVTLCVSWNEFCLTNRRFLPIFRTYWRQYFRCSPGPILWWQPLLLLSGFNTHLYALCSAYSLLRNAFFGMQATFTRAFKDDGWLSSSIFRWFCLRHYCICCIKSSRGYKAQKSAVSMCSKTQFGSSDTKDARYLVVISFAAAFPLPQIMTKMNVTCHYGLA